MKLLDMFRRSAPIVSNAPTAAALMQQFGSAPGVTPGQWSQTLSVESAMSVVGQCVTLIANKVGHYPLAIYKKLDGGGRDAATDHPIYRLINRQPNPYMTARSFRRLLTLWALTKGNGYAIIERDETLTPTALWPVAPDQATDIGYDSAGQLVYKFKLKGRQEPLIVYWFNVLHISGPGFDGIKGYSPIDMYKLTIGKAMSIESYGSAYFRNGIHGGIYFSVPGTLTPEARAILKMMLVEYAGSDKTNTPLLLENGLKPDIYGAVDNDSSQFIESERFSVEKVCSIYNVPPSKIGYTVGSTNSNSLTAALSFLSDTMGPWLSAWTTEIGAKLLREDEQETYYAEFDVSAEIAMDPKARAEYESALLTTGQATINEVRAGHHLPPVKGGESPLVNSAMVPLAVLVDRAAADLKNLQPSPDATAKTDDAAAAKTDDAATAAADATGQELQTSQASVLNGAQITAASAIVTAVAAGLMPLDAGLGQLQILFNLSEDQAKKIMGSAGTKTPTTPNPRPMVDIEHAT